MDTSDILVGDWGNVELDPESDRCFFAGDFATAATRYELLIEQTPSVRDTYDMELRLLHCYDQLCDWTARRRLIRDVEAKLDQEAAGSRPPGREPLCYVSTLLADAAFAAVARYRAKAIPRFAQCIPSGAPDAPVLLDDAKGLLRIAVVSLDFRCHSAGAPISPVMAALSSSGFESHAFSIAPSGLANRVAEANARYFESFSSLGSGSVETAISAIAQLRPHILIDTTRHIRGAATWLLNTRIAPVQISAWGYGGTTGGREVDFLLTDQISEPFFEIGATEKMLQMECYHPPIEGGNRRQLPREQERGAKVVLANFMAPYKISERTFGLWMEVLKAVPDSDLWLAAGCLESQVHRRTYAEENGVDPERLLFQDRVSPDQHSARLRQVGLVLEASDMGSSSSVPDGFLAGTPAVAMAPARSDNIAGASLLRATGLDRFVARNAGEFIELVRTLAADQAKYAEYVAGIETMGLDQYADGLSRSLRDACASGPFG